MSKGKGGFAVKKLPSGDMALQITSMADIFMILLLFLLKSFSSGAVSVTPSPGLILPPASSAEEQVQALTLEISEHAVQVDNTPVSPLKKFRFDAADLQQSGISTSLDAALEIQKKKREYIAKANSDVQLDKKLVLLADQRTPYVTLRSVLSGAAVHGFTDFKLVVIKKD